jgi:hypothetical protein
MKRYNWFRKLFLSASLSGLMLLAAGCEQGPSTANLSPIQPEITTNRPALAKAANSKKRLKKQHANTGGRVSKVMGHKGGKLELGDYKVEVPKDALTEEREISITVIDDAGNYYDVDFRPRRADFGADGWFKRPVKITITYDDADLSGIDPNTLAISWYDEATGEWIDVASEIDAKKNKITAWVWHFTQYSISVK